MRNFLIVLIALSSFNFAKASMPEEKGVLVRCYMYAKLPDGSKYDIIYKKTRVTVDSSKVSITPNSLGNNGTGDEEVRIPSGDSRVNYYLDLCNDLQAWVK